MATIIWEQLFGDSVPLEPYFGPPLRGYSGHQLEVAGQATIGEGGIPVLIVNHGMKLSPVTYHYIRYIPLHS